MQVYRRGDRGTVVAEIRDKLTRLGLLPAPHDADGAQNLDSARNLDSAQHFDDATDQAIRAFQQARGLRTDGVVGPETYRALDEARWQLGDRPLSYSVTHPYVGDDVAGLQQRLLEMGFDPGRADGRFGRQTEAALRDFQRNVGLSADGILGPSTMAALERLRRTVTGGSASERREEEQLLRGGSALSGRVVALDPGHGGDDLGACAHDLTEAEIAFDLARRVEGRLGALGVATYLTRGPDNQLDDESRARFANETGADLLISLHTDAALSEAPNGVATFFYGATLADRVVRSVVGERLATLLQRELVARTDLVDCRTHPKAWELLRLTRMPAVRLDIGYLTSRADAARLRTPEFRDTVAEAVVAAVQRLYLPADRDIPTGQFRMPALTG
jgi:N-acetylmuramoyl-L-alanine amidase